MAVGHILLLSWIYVLTCLHNVESIIPKQCVSNITITGGSGICCPTPPKFSQPCGGKGRGTCQPEYIQIEKLESNLWVDDRLNWPNRFFSFTCKCEGHFFGVACEECWYGWKGVNCDKPAKYIRRNVLSLSRSERRKLVKIIAQMPKVKTNYMVIVERDNAHSDPLWKPKFEQASLQYLLAYLHHYTSRNTLYDDVNDCDVYKKINNNHNVVGFASWHRYFMLFWEKELRKIAKRMFGWKDFAIPYWDWVDSSKCDVCTNDLMGAEGATKDGLTYLHSKSPFSKWVEYCGFPDTGTACFGCQSRWPNYKKLHRKYMATEFPSTKDLIFTLDKKDFYSGNGYKSMLKCNDMHNAFEGFCGRPNSTTPYLYMHNRVHNMVKGSFCCSATASNDPLFIVHHSQLDRIWHIWFEFNKPRLTAYPNHGVAYGNCRECNLIGFLPTVKHGDLFNHMNHFGVHYDNYKFGKQKYDGRKFMKYGPMYHKIEFELKYSINRLLKEELSNLTLDNFSKIVYPYLY